MSKKILIRIGILLIVLFGVTFFTFVLTDLSPVDAGESLAVRRYTRPTPEQIEAVRVELGLNKPFLIRYFSWIGAALHGDFGTSYNTGRPIADELAASMGPTLALASLSLLFSVLITIPLSVLSASRKGGIADRVIYITGIICMSLANYWIGFLLLMLFAVNIPIFSVMGTDSFKDYILPSLAIAIPISAACIRIFRSSLLEGYNSDFVTFARARGVPELKVAGMVNRYSLPPLVTLFAQNFGFTIAGSAMTETVFSIPGVGSMLVTALSARDTVTVNACVLVIALIFVLVNFAAEMVNFFLNPKEFGKEAGYGA